MITVGTGEGTRRVSKIPTLQGHTSRSTFQANACIPWKKWPLTPDGRSQRDMRPKYRLFRPCKCGIAKSSNPVTNASILHVDSMLPNENAYTNSVVVNVAVACRHLALELLGVLVPQLRGLSVQRRFAKRHKVSQQFSNRLRDRAPPPRPARSSCPGRPFRHNPARSMTHLLGSPSRLCRLSRTVRMLYAADHLVLRISKQIRPEKSTLGW